ncbi:hypothetical protein Pmani_035752 [Petrolisthes manimaculis]|uniref:Uncharacterized protein n=1 Tax=Petrolisthes manimaculis TaxID=1843537 RepID=A0AAE1NL04_9EUCA|nr:hypothetical protein Pmani_035752 [Petrolisthes manimaculis]
MSAQTGFRRAVDQVLGPDFQSLCLWFTAGEQRDWWRGGGEWRDDAGGCGGRVVGDGGGGTVVGDGGGEEGSGGMMQVVVEGGKWVMVVVVEGSGWYKQVASSQTGHLTRVPPSTLHAQAASKITSPFSQPFSLTLYNIEVLLSVNRITT